MFLRFFQLTNDYLAIKIHFDLTFLIIEFSMYFRCFRLLLVLSVLPSFSRKNRIKIRIFFNRKSMLPTSDTAISSVSIISSPLSVEIPSFVLPEIMSVEPNSLSSGELNEAKRYEEFSF